MPPVRVAWVAIGGLLASAAVAVAAGPARVLTTRGCYLVGQSVRFAGSGLAPRRAYEVAIDGVDFGQSRTDATGAFHARVIPGGLPAGSAQSVDQLDVTDGSSDASATFTVTRAAGARFLASRGDPRRLRAPFQVWGFSPSGTPREIYVHYVSPSGQVPDTTDLGRAGGQCGYRLTPPVRFFPFSPSTGTWTLQVDTSRRYERRPAGPVARIVVRIASG
jgi:hypothetical protein